MEFVINTSKIVFPFLVPTTLNICTHYICEYFHCDEWYSLLGLNIACNTCIDLKKFLKDHQNNMFWSIGTLLVSKMDLFVNEEIKIK